MSYFSTTGHSICHNVRCRAMFGLTCKLLDFSNSVSVKYWYKEYSGDKIILLVGFQ